MTWTVPDPGGTVTVISDDETTRTAVPRLPPKLTVTLPTKLAPQIVTFLPALLDPPTGVTREIVGGGTYVYLDVAVTWLEPPTVETET